MYYFRLSLLILFSFTVSFSQTKPRYEDYPAKKIYKGKTARVNIRSTPGATYYRTMLRETAKLGVTFAGYYAVNTWGCGSPCLVTGMVDLRTGKVIWPPIPQMLVWDVGFRSNSRLLIVNPRETLEKDAPPQWIEGDWPDELFFVWNGKHFVQIDPTRPRKKQKTRP